MMDLCNIEIVCGCSEAKTLPKIIRLKEKKFVDIVNEVKTCNRCCEVVSARGRVKGTDPWTEIDSDVLTVPGSGQAGTCEASAVVCMFGFKYVQIRCQTPAGSQPAPEPAVQTAAPSAFHVLFNAQTNINLPPPKAVKNRKEELYNDVRSFLSSRKVGFSRCDTDQGFYLLSVSEVKLIFFIISSSTLGLRQLTVFGLG